MTLTFFFLFVKNLFLFVGNCFLDRSDLEHRVNLTKVQLRIIDGFFNLI